MALCVVPNVNERVGCLTGEFDVLEQSCCARPLFVNRNARARSAMGVADGVGAALGNPRQERLGSQGAVDAGVGVEAVSRDSAHQWIRSPWLDMSY